jgi:UDP-N-acetyl-2-amino-2-deoxyglucuronate dehydrogenase
MYRFALIGCGNIAALHAECLTEAGSLVAACDVIPERAERFAEQYGARAFDSVDSLLKEKNEFDAAVICTPNGLHAEHVIRLLQAGKHVICEQPLCLTNAAAWQIVETEKFTRKKLHLVPCWQDESLSSYQELIRRRIGNLQSFHLHASIQPGNEGREWKNQLFPGGGLLYTEFFGLADLLGRIVGPVDVLESEVSGQKEGEAETEGQARLKAKSGAAGTFSWSANGPSSTELTLTGETGNLVLKGSVSELQSDDETGTLTFSQPRLEGLKMFYRNVDLSLQQGTVSNLMEGLPAVELTEKIYKQISSTEPAAH